MAPLRDGSGEPSRVGPAASPVCALASRDFRSATSFFELGRESQRSEVPACWVVGNLVQGALARSFQLEPGASIILGVAG